MKKIIMLLLLVSLSYGQRLVFGDATRSTVSINSYGANAVYFHKINVTTAITLDSVYHAGHSNTTVNVKYAIFRDNGTDPTTLIDSTAAIVNTANNVWKGVGFYNRPVLEVGVYWVASWGNASRSRERVGATSNVWRYQSGVTYGGAWITTATPVATQYNFDNVDLYIVGQAYVAPESPSTSTGEFKKFKKTGGYKTW